MMKGHGWIGENQTPVGMLPRADGRFRYGHSEAGQPAVSQTAEFWWVPLATKPPSAGTATMPKITVRVPMVFIV